MNLTELKRKKMGELIHMGSELNIEGVSGMRRQDLIFALLQHTAANKGEVYGDGVLETLPDGFGFEFRIVRGDTLVCEVMTRQCAIDRQSRQPIPLPDDFKQALRSFEASLHPKRAEP